MSSNDDARRLWEAIEPIHAVVYFETGVAEAAKALCLRGWWMGYFAGRFAPLGPIGPEPVTAMAFGFAAAMVARSLPDAWSYVPPERVVEHRIGDAADALRRSLGDIDSAAELSDLLWVAVEGCRFEGRPLGAAWASVERPSDPVAALWLATTILREHRGDGHVLAAVANGLSGLEATVSMVATGVVSRERIQPHRGWGDEEWDAAVAELQRRGVVDEAGAITPAGRELRAAVESLTDGLAASTVEQLGPNLDRALELSVPLSRHVVDTGVIPVPNPIGAPRP